MICSISTAQGKAVSKIIPATFANLAVIRCREAWESCVPTISRRFCCLPRASNYILKIVFITIPGRRLWNLVSPRYSNENKSGFKEKQTNNYPKYLIPKYSTFISGHENEGCQEGQKSERQNSTKETEMMSVCLLRKTCSYFCFLLLLHTLLNELVMYFKLPSKYLYPLDISNWIMTFKTD